ncbi:MAG: FliI/YscN family ATPase [Pseudomonadota bacterium]
MSVLEQLRDTALTQRVGKVLAIKGPLVYGYLPGATVGEQCSIISPDNEVTLAEIAAIEDGVATVMPFKPSIGLGCDHTLSALPEKITEAKVGDGLLGTVVDPFGKSLRGDAIKLDALTPLYGEHTNPIERAPINERFDTGVSVIDSFATLGRGQKVGIFAGSAVGKTTLVSQIAANAKADVIVVALVGERGREVNQYLEMLEAHGHGSRSVLIAATSDDSPIVRVRAAHYAASVADHFCDQGQHVMLVIDSLTRFAMAQREIGLAVGEPPTSGGYTPSVFTQLTNLVERAGSFKNPRGQITGVFSVLVEADDLNDPIVDCCRSILDGAIVLSRELANVGQFPAVDLLTTNSRLQHALLDNDQMTLIRRAQKAYVQYLEAKELKKIGMSEVADKALDTDYDIGEALLAYLAQGQDEVREPNENFVRLARLLERAR